MDILIDDGGHSMRQLIITYEEMFDHVKEDGIYLFEDLHTSYWRKFGGGFRRRGTFIELSKKWIDQLNANHSKQVVFRPNHFTESVFSMHFFDSLLILQKRRHVENRELASGEKIPFESFLVKRNKIAGILRPAIVAIDRALIFFRLKDIFRR